MATSTPTQAFLTHFISANNLPTSYFEAANQYFLPLIEQLAKKQKTNKKQLVIGINGAQGSGKSTVSDLIVAGLIQLHQIRACTLSIDDFYKTRVEREHLAQTVHPLLKTRGVPGTHDIDLALTTLDELTALSGTIHLPRFHKALDDRAPTNEFDTIQAPVDVVILEGWCVGATAQSPEQLQAPINALERNEDNNGDWRRYANQQLAQSYQTLYNTLDVLVMLKAPSFNCVYQWRLEQENRLRQKLESQGKTTAELMSASEVERFIQFYQRLTEHQINTLPSQCHVVFELNEHRKIVSSQENTAL